MMTWPARAEDVDRAAKAIMKEAGSDFDGPNNIAEYYRRLARAALATIPDAGAEDVTGAMVRAFSDEWTNPSYSPQMRTGERIELALRAALAVMPRRDERAGMLRAAEICDRHAAQEEQSQRREEALRRAGNLDADPSYYLWAAQSHHSSARAIRAEAEALRTSTPEQPRDDGWQPIETAPRDGKRVLLYFPDWDNGNPVRLGGFSNIEGVWRIAAGPCLVELPTKWQPLPAPPAPVTK